MDRGDVGWANTVPSWQRQDSGLCLLALPVTSELGPASVLSLWSIITWSTFQGEEGACKCVYM